MGYWNTGEDGTSFVGSEMVWGDRPGDIMGGALEDIIKAFEEDMGRKPTSAELIAGLKFGLGGLEEELVPTKCVAVQLTRTTRATVMIDRSLAVTLIADTEAAYKPEVIEALSDDDLVDLLVHQYNGRAAVRDAVHLAMFDKEREARFVHHLEATPIG